MKTFVITHPEHGEAVCDDRQLDHFMENGWTKKEDADQADAGPKKKAKA
jgi:hypothetical protein